MLRIQVQHLERIGGKKKKTVVNFEAEQGHFKMVKTLRSWKDRTVKFKNFKIQKD